MPRTAKKVLRLSRDLDLPLDAITEKIDVFGQSGGGKTYLAMKLAELMLKACAQIVVLDSAGVWWGLRASADGKHAGFPIVVIGGEHGDLPISITRVKSSRGGKGDTIVTSGAAVADLVVGRGISAVLDVSELLDDEMISFAYDFVVRFFWLKKRSKRPVHFFIEECQEFIPETTDSDLQFKLRAALVRMMKIGRNYGIGWSAITQEPQAASKRALNQAGTLMVVRTIGAHERDAISKTARSKARSKEQLALIDVLPELETGQALVWSPSWLKFAGVVRVDRKITFDSSKTPDVGTRIRQPRVLADVELAKLREAMKGVVEEAARDNPELLRRRISELESEVAAKRVVPVAKTVEKKINTKPLKGLIMKLDAAVKRAERLYAKALKGLNLLHESVSSFSKAQLQLAEVLRLTKLGAPPGAAPAVTSSAHAIDPFAPTTWPPHSRVLHAPPSPKNGTAPHVQTAPVLTQISKPTSQPVGGTISPYQLEILTTLASRRPMRPTATQLALLAGKSHRSSTWITAMAALKRGGWMIVDRGQLDITAAGLSMCGASGAVIPRSGAEVIDGWKKALPDYERRLFEALLNHATLDRDQLGAVASVSPKSSTFIQAVSTLKKNGLIEASDGLFRVSQTIQNARASA